MKPSVQRPQIGLTVVEWGAIDLSEGEARAQGAIAEPGTIPAGLRRRLGIFERAVVQTVLGLSAPDRAAKITLGSRYGNLTGAAKILEALADGEPPSPTLFSHSVLNAGCGVANQVRRDRSSHTAVSASCHTLHGALTEAWLQTGDDDDATHIIVLADAPFPASYKALRTDWHADICIGLRVERRAQSAPQDTNALGHGGFQTLRTALQGGHRALTYGDGMWATAQ